MRTYLYILLLSLLWSTAKAQEIKGRVLDQLDETPLAGVIISLDGSVVKHQTDMEGNFVMFLQPGIHKLNVYHLAYKTETVVIEVPLKKQLIIRLSSQSRQLQEITINTGYQRISKERNSGSFVQVDEALLNRTVSTGIIDRLQNVVPGLIFNKAMGNANNQSQISIRGQATLFSRPDPLIVIDNFPYDGDLNNINPNDVESISILKDAAAASIWGSKAANGVIVITTKRGKYNQTDRFSFSSNLTIGNRPDLFYTAAMSSADYIEIEKRRFNEGAYKALESSRGKDALSPVVELLIAKRDGKIDPALVDQQVEALKNQDIRNDYRDFLYRRNINQQYAFNLNGGSAYQHYFISAGYDKNLENLVGNAYTRSSFNANHTLALLHQKLELTTGIAYIQSKTSMNNSGKIEMMPFTQIYPYARLVDEAGNPAVVFKDYRSPYLQEVENLGQGLLDWRYRPLEELKFADRNRRLRDYRMNASLKYKITPDINAEALYQYGYTHTEELNNQTLQSYYTRNEINRLTKVNPSGSLTRPIPLGDILDNSTLANETQRFRGQLNYNKSWNGVHTLSALGGFEFSDSRILGSQYRFYGYEPEFASQKIVDYVNGFTSYVNPLSTTNKIMNKDGVSEFNDRFISYYANASYTYKDRYNLYGSIRLDKSNIYGVKTNQKGVPLWSGGFGWTISKEAFYDVSWLPYLKFRTTYGYNGNVNKSLSAYTTARYRTNAPTTLLPYASIVNPPNPQLRWEKVQVWNMGIDFGLKNNWLTGSLEFYFKRGIDLIGDALFPPSSGITQFRGNTASTKGNGFDLVLNSKNIDSRFKWNTNFMLSLSKDRVTHYEVKSSITNSYLLSPASVPVVGKPLYSLYSYRWAGLDPQNGDPQGYLDGQVSKDYTKLVQSSGPESLVFHGSLRPTVYGALRNTFSYGDFSLSANISYRLGYFFRRNSIRYTASSTGQNDYGLSSGHGDYALRWQHPGDEAFTNVPSIPLVANGNRDSFYSYAQVLVAKGDHIRLQDIRLAYDIKGFKLFSGHSTGQLYVMAENIGILWKAYKGKEDPDYAVAGSMPAPRSVSVGFRMGF